MQVRDLDEPPTHVPLVGRRRGREWAHAPLRTQEHVLRRSRHPDSGTETIHAPFRSAPRCPWHPEATERCANGLPCTPATLPFPFAGKAKRASGWNGDGNKHVHACACACVRARHLTEEGAQRSVTSFSRTRNFTASSCPAPQATSSALLPVCGRVAANHRNHRLRSACTKLRTEFSSLRSCRDLILSIHSMMPSRPHWQAMSQSSSLECWHTCGKKAFTAQLGV